MSKGTQSHGGIHTPVVACYHAVHDYRPGGLPVVSVMMEKSQEVLRKKVNEQNTTHVLTLNEAMHILRITGDTRILDAICAEAGVVWFAPENVPKEPADMDVLASGTTLMGRTVSVLTELQAALADGEIDVVERARIDQRIMELHQSISHISETARQFEPTKEGV